MSARSIAAIVIFSASVALSPVSPGATENSSDSPVVTVASGANHGGSSVAHSAVGSGPAGVSSAPAIRPGTTQASVGAQRPMPAINNPRPYLAGSKLGQRPPTIRLPIQPGVSQRSYSVRPPLSNSSSPGEKSQPRISPHRAVPEQKGSTNVFTTRDGRQHQGNWSRHDPANKRLFDRQTQDRLRNWQGRKPGFTEACHRHNDHHHHHHNRDWWRHHCNAVVLVDWGFWGWSDGWWYPAWGYDPYYAAYEYDGPIYGYDGLLPDEIVANVQSELQRLGYFPYEVDGVFGPLTQEAIANYQSDRGLPVTGAIDPQTLTALGFL